MNSLPEVTRSIQGLVDGFLARLPYLAIAVVVFALFWLLSRGLKRLVARLAHGSANSRRYVLGLVLGRLVSGVTILVGALVALVIAIPGFTPGQLVSLLGIGGVAIGFAFKEILQNFLAGILLLVSEPFRIGDQISVTGFEGTVEDIQTRATFLKTYDGQRVVIPNATLFTNSVTVITAYGQRRLTLDVKLGPETDPERAKPALLAALAGVPGAVENPAPAARMQDFPDASAQAGTLVRLTWWVASPEIGPATPGAPHGTDAATARDAALAAVRRALATVDKAPASPPPAA